MKKKITSLIALFMVMVMALTGCGSSGSSSDSSADAGEPKYGGQLDITTGTVSSLDPMFESVDEPMSRHIFETVLALDETGTPQTGLCSYKYSDDQLTLTLTLRDGIKFHNGDTVNAEDVVASIKRWAENISFGKSYVGKYMDSISAADDKTTVIKFKSIASAAIYALAYEYQGAYVMPKEVCEEFPTSAVTDNSKIIGTGPYKLVEWKSDAYVMTERYTDYKATGNACGGSAGNKYAYCDKICFWFASDSDAKMNGLVSGQYDLYRLADYSAYASLKDDPNFKVEMISDGTKPALVFNKSQGVCSNKLVRQAILAALDMDQVMLGAFNTKELYDLTGSWTPIGSAYYCDNSKYNQKDLSKAKELLAQSGYNGETVTYITDTTGYYYETAMIVTNAMRSIGMNVDLQTMDQATLYTVRKDPSKYDIFAVGFTAKADCSMMAFLGDTWPGEWVSEKKTDIINKMNATTDAQTRIGLWKEMTDLIYDEVPVITFGERKNCTIVAKNIMNATYSGSEPYYWNVWINE